jgi:hypothetical protein
VQANAIVSTVRIGFVGFIALLAGAVALLRATGRGRNGWELLMVETLACTPPIFMCVENYFHPQDLVAMGLVMAALACMLRHRWIVAGILLGLAIITQQFALLALAPLFVVAPRQERVKLLVAALCSSAAVIIPLGIITKGGAVRAALFGSSRVSLVASGVIHTRGGTLVAMLHLHGVPLFMVARIAPIAGAMVLAGIFVRQLGLVMLSVVPLISLIATSLLFRLVFEQNLFGYYFMAAGAMLIVLDVVRGSIRSYTVLWIGLATLAFNPVPWGREVQRQSVFLLIAGVGLAFILYDLLHHRVRAHLVLWFGFVVCACEPFLWRVPADHQLITSWVWQIVLVSTAATLAIAPLVTLARGRHPALARTRHPSSQISAGSMR